MLEKFKNKIASLNSEINHDKEERHKLEADLHKANENEQELRNRINDLERMLTQEKQDKEIEISKERSEKEKLKEELAESKRNEEDLQKQCEELEADITKLKQETADFYSSDRFMTRSETFM